MSSNSTSAAITRNFLPGKYFRLMELPQEIRLLIWSRVFHIDQVKQTRMAHFVSNLGHIITPYGKRHLGHPGIAVLLTNRKIYFEAREVLYASRLFSIGINQLSCIGNNSKPCTPVTYQAIPATWNMRFREHLYLMAELNVYIHLDKAVVRRSEADPPAQPDDIVLDAIRTAFLNKAPSGNLPFMNISLQHLLQGHNGNAALLPLPNIPAAPVNFHAQVNPAVNLAVNPALIPFANLAVNAPVNAVANVNGVAINVARGPGSALWRALENQKLDNVMVIKAALEELCQVLSMCEKLKEINVFYIDRLGDCSPAGLGFNILHPFKTLARSVRCRITYVPIPGRPNQSRPDDMDSSPRMDGASFKQDTNFHDTLCHLKAISFVSNVDLSPWCIAELDRRLNSG